MYKRAVIWMGVLFVSTTSMAALVSDKIAQPLIDYYHDLNATVMAATTCPPDEYVSNIGRAVIGFYLAWHSSQSDLSESVERYCCCG